MPFRGAPRKYFTDRERTEAYKRQQNNYANNKLYECFECDVKVNLGNKSKHLHSKKHYRNCFDRRSSGSS